MKSKTEWQTTGERKRCELVYCVRGVVNVVTKDELEWRIQSDVQPSLCCNICVFSSSISQHWTLSRAWKRPSNRP